MLEGVDKYSNLIGSVYYPDGDIAKDLALELVQNVCMHTATIYQAVVTLVQKLCLCELKKDNDNLFSVMILLRVKVD